MMEKTMRDEPVNSNPRSSLIPHRTLTSVDRQSLRKTMRQRRNTMPKAAKHSAALRIALHLRKHVFRPGRRIAMYAAFDGEIDTARAAAIARRMHCQLFAPVIVDAQRRQMEFVRVTAATSHLNNAWGISEPRDALLRRIDARRLDVILIPVVAFDAHGWRLGFGGGYYDRKLAFKRHRSSIKPVLIGIGYEFQRISPVAAASWDVKLDAIVTPRGWQRCR
jgi:5-formyltetrahydrofolate cyclo-ligase